MLPCPYCGAEFSLKRNLDRHQRTVKTCIAVQKEQGAQIREDRFTCECGEAFTRRHDLTRHRKSCVTDEKAIATVINDNSTTNYNTVNQINIHFGSTMSALTPEIIAEKVLEVLSLGAVEKGLAHMTEEVARPVFSNEKNNWLVRVADASRSKLIMRTDEGDQPDHQGRNTTMLLKQPFIEASMLALEQTEHPRDVESTIEEIKDDDTYDKETMGALLRVAPTKFKQTNPLIFTEAHQLALDKSMAKLDKIMAKRKRLQDKKCALEAERVRNDFLDKSQDLHDGTFWHPVHRYVIQPDQEHEFLIIGRRAKRSDTTLPLTKEDVKSIYTLGLAPQLDAQYHTKATRD